MDKWEICFVDLKTRTLQYVTSEGLKKEKIGRPTGGKNISAADASARLVAHLGLAGWELVSAAGGTKPVLYFKRRCFE
jgi:hypothetical protein